LFQLQVEIRYCEKRAYDLFLQNLVKARVTSRSGRKRSQPGSPRR